MSCKDFLFLGMLIVIGALLFGNLLRPNQPLAYTLPDAPEGAGQSVAISADGDSAWVVVGNKVYYISLKSRSEVQNRTITVIDDEVLH